MHFQVQVLRILFLAHFVPNFTLQKNNSIFNNSRIVRIYMALTQAYFYFIILFVFFFVFYWDHKGQSILIFTIITGANLKGANLEGSQLSNSYLRLAVLKNTNMRNCVLREASLAGADLEVWKMIYLVTFGFYS